MSEPTQARGLTAPEQAAAAVTALFVPGDRPDRFAKAATSGADVVIIDLEDAVAPPDKAGALESVLDALGTDRRLQALVRVNALGSASCARETAALLELAAEPGHGLLGCVVPKAERSPELAAFAERMPEGMALIPLIESAAGLVHSLDLARVPGVTRLAFGAIDFALDTVSNGERILDYARAQLVVNSRAAELAPPLDSPSPDIRDRARVAESAAAARAFGFGGKLCIHPAQLPAVKEAFSPTEQEIEWALSVIDAEGGAAQVDGQMVDRPVTERAKRILARTAGHRSKAY